MKLRTISTKFILQLVLIDLLFLFILFYFYQQILRSMMRNYIMLIMVFKGKIYNILICKQKQVKKCG